MNRCEAFIMNEVNKDRKTYYNDIEGIFVSFYPKLDKAYIDCLGDTVWLDAVGIQDAICQYQWLNRAHIKLVG